MIDDLRAQLAGARAEAASRERACGDAADAQLASSAERAALLEVAGLAGISVMALVEENTAAGVHYGIDRVSANGTHYMLLYNMGAASTQVTLFAYDSYNSTDKLSRKNVTVGQGRVLAKAYDLELSGRALDGLLVDFVAEAFNKDPKVSKKLDASAKGDLRNVPLAMVKVAKAVVKAKEVLSANDAFPVNLEGVLPDVDYKVALSRKILDEAASALWPRVTVIVDRVLKAAALTPADVNAVELVGGGVRVPKIQALLKDFFAPKTKEGKAAAAKAEAASKAGGGGGSDTATGVGATVVGTHMNGDESFALGAVFMAANRSTSLKVRKVGMVDANTFAVGLRLAHAPSSPAAPAAAGGGGDGTPASKPWSKRSANLFGLYNSGEDNKKRITFHSTRDITATLYYENTTDPLAPALPPGTSDILGRYTISGIEELMANASVAARGNPKINIVFTQDLNGMVVLTKAEATQEEEVWVPEPTAKPTPTPKNATTSGKNATAANATAANATTSGEEAPAAAAAEGGAVAAGEAASTNGTTSSSTSSPKLKMVKNTLRFPLTITLNVTGAYPVKPLTEAQKAAVLERFAVLKAEDDKKRMVETAKSELEATVYKFRDDLEAAEEDIKKVTTAAQREKMSEAISAMTLWLEEDGASAKYDEYKSKTSELKREMEPAFFRKEELGKRPKAIKAAEDEIRAWVDRASKWNETHPHVRF